MTKRGVCALLLLLAVGTVSAAQLSVEWDRAGGASGYRIYTGIPGSYDTSYDVGNVTRATVEVRSADYAVAVTAYNAAGQSGFSNEINVRCVGDEACDYQPVVWCQECPACPEPEICPECPPCPAAQECPVLGIQQQVFTTRTEFARNPDGSIDWDATVSTTNTETIFVGRSECDQ